MRKKIFELKRISYIKMKMLNYYLDFGINIIKHNFFLFEFLMKYSLSFFNYRKYIFFFNSLLNINFTHKKLFFYKKIRKKETRK